MQFRKGIVVNQRDLIRSEERRSLGAIEGERKGIAGTVVTTRIMRSLASRIAVVFASRLR